MTPFHLRLPATSANLGPGFDAVALALELFLDIRATLSDSYSIAATGRNVDICTRIHRNLMLSIYEETLRAAGSPIRPLAIDLVNEIPIGMGLGSSAAARLGGLGLANYFGDLGWTGDRILEEACRLEGHPDNAAACWLGGFTVAAGVGPAMRAVSIEPPSDWMALIVLPDQPLSTSVARAILPDTYSRADAVSNIQSVAMLATAFQYQRLDLLKLAMIDRLHQPFRSTVCTLLPLLLPLSGIGAISGVALSGAGPAILALTSKGAIRQAREEIAAVLLVDSPVEILEVALGRVVRVQSP